MGQKVHPIGFRLGVIRSWESKWYEERNYAKWLHEDIKLREFVKEKLGQAGISADRDRARRQQGEDQRPHGAPGHRHRQARRRDRDHQEGPPGPHGERGLPERRRGPQGRDRRAAGGREHRDAARAPHRLPARDEEVGADRAQVRRQGHPRRLLRPPRRRRDGALRVVPRGPRAAAHAARRHRLRLRRGEDHLRQDRRARSGSCAARSCRSRPCAAPRPTGARP